MFKKYKKQLIISTIIILLPIAFGLLLWDQLPESFAIHWGVDGQPDSWSSKGFAIFCAPVLLVVLQFFCLWITETTNRGNQQSPKVMNLIFCIVPVLSLLCNGMIYAAALGMTWDIAAVMPVLMGLLFILMGNYMPKCTRNTTIGIKVIWALYNDENWNATHRFAGKTWVVGGLITIFTALLPATVGYPIMFTALTSAGAGPTLYSYLYYRNQLKAGTAVPIKDIPMDETTKATRRIAWIAVTVILIACSFVMFYGSISFDFREDALVMDATFYAPVTLRYDNIDEIEYREGTVDGVRNNGFGSMKLLLGYFENKEFGIYSRYTYYKTDGCIVVSANGHTLVFSGENAAETQELYQELLKRIR